MPQRKTKSGSRVGKKDGAIQHTVFVVSKFETVQENEEMFVHILRRIVHAKIARRDGTVVRILA